MSCTLPEDLEGILSFCYDSNIHYAESKLDIKLSALGGLGVFAATDLKPGEVLLRVPKDAVFSASNSSIANLLLEEEIDGMLALNLAFIYEISVFGLRSHWYRYLKSIKLEDQNGLLYLPPSCWPDERKRQLSKTSLDTLFNALEPERDLKTGYEVALDLAQKWHREAGLSLPEGFFDEGDREAQFARFVATAYAVSSRAFEIDSYHESALVPIADLFNHHVSTPDVRFESLYEVCPLCGEMGVCGHSMEEGEMEDEMESEGEEEEGTEGEGDKEDEMEDVTGEDEDEVDAEEEDDTAEEKEDEVEEEGDEADEDGVGADTQNKQNSTSTKELTPQLIQELELEADNLPLPKPKKDTLSNGRTAFDDLDADTCVDIVLARPISKNVEIFNSYGDLSNPLLIARYGFCVPNNPFDTVHLGHEVEKLWRDSKRTLSPRFEWWIDSGFELFMNWTRAMSEEDQSDSDEEQAEAEAPELESDDEQSEASSEAGSDAALPKWQEELCIDHEGTPTSALRALVTILTFPNAKWAKFIKNSHNSGKMWNKMKTLSAPADKAARALLKNLLLSKKQSYTCSPSDLHNEPVRVLLSSELEIIDKCLTALKAPAPRT